MADALVVYAYAKCSTCRDAVAWLRAKNIRFVEKPIYETPPSVPELRRMLGFQNGELKRLFNTSGLEYKALGMKERFPTLNEEEALALLSTHGKLVKRPFLLGKDVGLVGFQPERWAESLT